MCEVATIAVVSITVYACKCSTCTVAWKYIQLNILPYVIDWLFVLILGILMAVLSFIIDYLIEQIRRGEMQAISEVTNILEQLWRITR